MKPARIVDSNTSHIHLLAEFPSGSSITLTCSWVNAKSPAAYAVYGHKASLQIGAGGERVELVPERDFANAIGPETLSGLQPEDVRLHEKNWFDCIRSGKKTNADIELAIRAQTVLSLAEMSDRLKVTCLFNERTREIRDHNGKSIAPLTYAA